jgi:2-polyprenyl-3-methyl-5-hydroxy-6-metoxy-1,4-benzoquinol methylase
MAAYIESSIYNQPGLRGCHSYVLPALMKLTRTLQSGSRVLDVGCGNGSLAAEFSMRGMKVTGIDLSDSGIRLARSSYPGIRFEQIAADCNLLRELNDEPFDLVYSSEVIEHLYDPRSLVAGCYEATKPFGKFICTTPYHGYLKNVALSVAGKWDHHHDPLFDGGHIKFFSRKTLSRLLSETGFRDLHFMGAGRATFLWASMIISGRK